MSILKDDNVIDCLPQDLDEALCEFITDAMLRLHPMDQDPNPYGLNISFATEDGDRISMKRECQCDGPECPWCDGDPEEAETEEEREVYASAGYVENHRAPNFWIRIGCWDVRIWWHKYPGRGMAILGISDVAGLKALRNAFDAWADANSDMIWARSAECFTEDALGQMDDPLRSAIAKAFAAQMVLAKDKTAEAESLRALGDSMVRTGYAHFQADLIGKRLERHKLPKHHDNEDLPEDLVMELSLDSRLNWLFRHLDIEGGVAAMRKDVADELALISGGDPEPEDPVAAKARAGNEPDF